MPMSPLCVALVARPWRRLSGLLQGKRRGPAETILMHVPLCTTPDALPLGPSSEGSVCFRLRSWSDQVSSSAQRHSTEALDWRPPTHLCFRPLIRVWEEMAAGKRSGSRQSARDMLSRVAQSELLTRGTLSSDAVASQCDLVADLLSIVIAPALSDRLLIGVSPPFQLGTVSVSTGWQRAFVDSGLEEALWDRVREPATCGLLELSLYLTVASQLCGFSSSWMRRIPVVLEGCSGESRHFELRLSCDFVEVKDPEATLSRHGVDLLELRRHWSDLDYLRARFPLDALEITGFTVVEAVEVSHQHARNRLRQTLSLHGALLDPSLTALVESHMRDLLQIPDLAVGVVGAERQRFYLFHAESDNLGHAFEPLVSDELSAGLAELARTGEFLCVEDLRECPPGEPALALLRTEKSRSMLWAPLFVAEGEDQEQPGRPCCAVPGTPATGESLGFDDPESQGGRCVGVLQLSSPTPRAFDARTVFALRGLRVHFAQAVQRAFERLEERVQAVIKHQYTSIHEAVEWRFREAAMACLCQRGRTARVVPEEIVFPDVFPLYGISDVRESSTLRRRAIQADLLTQLRMLVEIMDLGGAASPMTCLEYLRSLLYERIARIEPELSAGDEIGIVEFVRGDVESLFGTLEEMGEEVARAIRRYRAVVDSSLGMVYARRREFDESVRMLNEAIAHYLTDRQALAQAVTPHYFELHKTDGVDHTMYAGRSMQKDGGFDSFALNNLRLWQLVTMCGVARLTRELLDRLPSPLQTTHLVLVQHLPLSIRFHPEEKQFCVAGAYNIRYEILKKRIDKASILATGERLTQPGKLAVVYSQPREAQEYRSYLSWLADRGEVSDFVEDLELEELPGVQGLRALRVDVCDLTQGGETQKS